MRHPATHLTLEEYEQMIPGLEDRLALRSDELNQAMDEYRDLDSQRRQHLEEIGTDMSEPVDADPQLDHLLQEIGVLRSQYHQAKYDLEETRRQYIELRDYVDLNGDADEEDDILAQPERDVLEEQE